MAVPLAEAAGGSTLDAEANAPDARSRATAAPDSWRFTAGMLPGGSWMPQTGQLDCRVPSATPADCAAKAGPSHVCPGGSGRLPGPRYFWKTISVILNLFSFPLTLLSTSSVTVWTLLG